jgi:hypothetical protein
MAPGRILLNKLGWMSEGESGCKVHFLTLFCNSDICCHLILS